MNGSIKKSCVRFTIIILLTLVPCILPLHASSDRIAIVKSGSKSYFNQTIETLISHVEDALTFKIIDAESIDANSELLNQSDRIITLGFNATQKVSERFPKLLDRYARQPAFH